MTSNAHLIDRKPSLTVADILEFTRLRLTTMIVITVAVGYILGAAGSFAWLPFISVLIGLGLVSAGSTALNQVWERVSDGLMSRTAERPIALGKIPPLTGSLVGLAMIAVGLIILVVGNDPLTAIVAGLSGAVYVVIYTPLKKISSFNTLVGAISGALPPVVGWVAATGEISLGAISLFAILFVWQLIHLFAIAWVYRDEYKRAGLVMLSVVDRTDGELTMRLIVLFCLSMIPVSLLPVFTGMSGFFYLAAAVVLGIWFLLAGIKLVRTRTTNQARKLFFTSIGYLPLLLIALVVDRLI